MLTNLSITSIAGGMAAVIFTAQEARSLALHSFRWTSMFHHKTLPSGPNSKDAILEAKQAKQMFSCCFNLHQCYLVMNEPIFLGSLSFCAPLVEARVEFCHRCFQIARRHRSKLFEGFNSTSWGLLVENENWQACRSNKNIS